MSTEITISAKTHSSVYAVCFRNAALLACLDISGKDLLLPKPELGF